MTLIIRQVSMVTAQVQLTASSFMVYCIYSNARLGF